MKQFPTPDDGFGLIGEVRTFTHDGVEWRVFEYQSPLAPGSAPMLIVLSSNAYRESPIYPADWRELPPTQLLRELL